MIVKLHTQELQAFDDIRALVAGRQVADFEINGRDDAYSLARDTLRRFSYRRRSRADKGFLRRYRIAVTARPAPRSRARSLTTPIKGRA